MKDKAARGILWSTLEFGGGEGIAFVVFLVLARLVAPADFGVVALAGIFVVIVQMFLFHGFPDALVQREHVDELHFSTAFWANLFIATAFTLAIAATADVWARVFNEPLLADVLVWMMPIVISTALTSIHQAVFRRRLRFDALAMRALFGISAGGVVGVTLALMGYGAWSLVFQQLTNGIVSIAVIWWRCDWQPGLRFSWRRLHEMLAFSANAVGSSLIILIVRRMDTALVGYFFDARTVGYYFLVQRLLFAFGLVILSSVEAITMPLLSRLQKDREQFRAVFTTLLYYVQSIWMPVVVGFGLVAAQLLPAVFGEKWQPSVALAEIMSLIGFSNALGYFTNRALFAADRPGTYLRLTIVQLVLNLVIFLPAVSFGTVGVASAFVLTNVAILPFHMQALVRADCLDASRLMRRLRAPFAATLAMMAVVMAVQAIFDADPAIELPLAVLIGAGAYLCVFAILAPGDVHEAIGFFASARAPAPAPEPEGTPRASHSEWREPLRRAAAGDRVS